MTKLEYRIAQDICTLNRWDKPKGLEEIPFEKHDFKTAMLVLENYVPHEEWNKVWNNKITAEDCQ